MDRKGIVSIASKACFYRVRLFINSGIFIVNHFIAYPKMAIQAIEVSTPFNTVNVLDKRTIVSDISIDFEIISITQMFSE